MSEWAMNRYVPAEVQDALIRNGRMLFFLQERQTDNAHVCIDLRDGGLYVAVFMKSPYFDTRDFNAPQFTAVSYDQLPALIELAMQDERGKAAGAYAGMTQKNWKTYLEKK